VAKGAAKAGFKLKRGNLHLKLFRSSIIARRGCEREEVEKGANLKPGPIVHPGSVNREGKCRGVGFKGGGLRKGVRCLIEGANLK